MRPILFALGLMLMAAPAAAQDFVSAWITQLQTDGYDDISVERTWLGRIRIVAEKDDIDREIILNRATGEVLRDYSEAEDGGFRLPLGWVVDLDDDDDEEEDDDKRGKGDDDD